MMDMRRGTRLIRALVAALLLAWCAAVVPASAAGLIPCAIDPPVVVAPGSMANASDHHGHSSKTPQVAARIACGCPLMTGWVAPGIASLGIPSTGSQIPPHLQQALPSGLLPAPATPPPKIAV